MRNKAKGRDTQCAVNARSRGTQISTVCVYSEVGRIIYYCVGVEGLIYVRIKALKKGRGQREEEERAEGGRIYTKEES